MVYVLVVPGPINDAVDARILEWHAEDGRPLSPGDLIVELETNKAIVEIRAAQSGVFRRRLWPEGTWRRMGNPLAILSDAAESPLPETPDGLPIWQTEFQLT